MYDPILLVNIFPMYQSYSHDNKDSHKDNKNSHKYKCTTTVMKSEE